MGPEQEDRLWPLSYTSPGCIVIRIDARRARRLTVGLNFLAIVTSTSNRASAQPNRAQ